MTPNAPPNFEALYDSLLEEQKQLLETAILSGRAQSFDEYRYMTGQLRGLVVAENLFKDLIDRWENRSDPQR